MWLAAQHREACVGRTGVPPCTRALRRVQQPLQTRQGLGSTTPANGVQAPEQVPRGGSFPRPATDGGEDVCPALRLATCPASTPGDSRRGRARRGWGRSSVRPSGSPELRAAPVPTLGPPGPSAPATCPVRPLGRLGLGPEQPVRLRRCRPNGAWMRNAVFQASSCEPVAFGQGDIR